MSKKSKLLQSSIVVVGAALISTSAYSRNMSETNAGVLFHTPANCGVCGVRNMCSEFENVNSIVQQQVNVVMDNYRNMLQERKDLIIDKLNLYSDWIMACDTLTIVNNHTITTDGVTANIKTSENCIDNNSKYNYLSVATNNYTLQSYYNLYDKYMRAAMFNSEQNSGWVDLTKSYSLQLEHFILNQLPYNMMPDTVRSIQDYITKQTPIKVETIDCVEYLVFAGEVDTNIVSLSSDNADYMSLHVAMEDDLMRIVINCSFPEGSPIESETYTYFVTRDINTVVIPDAVSNASTETKPIEDFYKSIGGE